MESSLIILKFFFFNTQQTKKRDVRSVILLFLADVVGIMKIIVQQLFAMFPAA